MIPIPIISQGHRRGPLCAPHRGPHRARLRGAEGGWRRGGLGPSQLWGRQRHGENMAKSAGVLGGFGQFLGGNLVNFGNFRRSNVDL